MLRQAVSFRMLIFLAVLTLQLFNPPSRQSLFAQSSFYQGKTLQVVVGSTPGGLYDRWARLFARYMGKYIPGNPETVPQNMPGGGSMVAANYLYNIAKPDGLTVGMFQTYMYLQQLTAQPEVRFDLRKFNWLGSQEKGTMMLYVRADSPYRTIDDIVQAKEPPKCGASGATDQTNLMAKILEETVGAKFHVILGYPGGSEVDLAFERGEVVCRTTRITVHFSREPFLTWDKKGFDRHLLQAGRERDVRLAEVPTLYELMDKYKAPEMGRRIARVILAGEELGRPMVAPPGTPPDRVKILREAYAKTLKDPELLAEVTKSRIEIDPSTGEGIQALIHEIMNQPPEVVERLKKMFPSK
ncbi:MAG TPA: tripartite tricarboxylate transporter substrate-binding protein [Candidatus Acidoferrales bacterium]|nr:tripartite tricarboxylate transporter substrate-binding protein [Candidatus Acidoferrales bacterium]